MVELSQFLVREIIGCYTHFEATEIFAVRSKGQAAENILTILVAEERPDTAPIAAHYLGDRIKLKSVDWVCGVKRYTRPISDLLSELAALDSSGKWNGSGEVLQFGDLQKVPAQFVPPDSSTVVAWNRVLKNNFWNGSYIFEWSDRKKASFDALFDTPSLLQELAENVRAVVPIDLASLSDRIGNLVVQLPVNALMSNFQPRRNGECGVSFAWHPNVKPRSLRATTHFEFDGVVNGYASSQIDQPDTTLITGGTRGSHRGFLWDDEKQILLASSGPTSFIETIAINLRPVGTEPRTFAYTRSDGKEVDTRISVNSGSLPTIVGDPDGDETGGRTRGRLYRERESKLTQDRTFVQYKPSGDHSSREKALKDLRALINRFGEKGAWLWDPYLGAYDVLETLFYSSNSSADLRALTAAKERPAATDNAAPATGTAASSAKQRFVERQRDILQGVRSNWRGLKLEFRARVGQAGWGFHDRFLIFPQMEGAALVWSLGTSVNSIGMEHHILQKVDDGQLVTDAFVDLWNQLAAPEYLVWKKP